jgi:hypothetical protein
VSAYVQAGSPYRIGGRFRDRLEWSWLIHGLMGTVPIVVVFELAQCAQEMALVPDRGAVEEFVAQLLHPAFRDRVHARYPDAAQDSSDTGVGEDTVE